MRLKAFYLSKRPYFLMTVMVTYFPPPPPRNKGWQLITVFPRFYLFIHCRNVKRILFIRFLCLKKCRANGMSAELLYTLYSVHWQRVWFSDLFITNPIHYCHGTHIHLNNLRITQPHVYFPFILYMIRTI